MEARQGNKDPLWAWAIVIVLHGGLLYLGWQGGSARPGTEVEPAEQRLRVRWLQPPARPVITASPASPTTARQAQSTITGPPRLPIPTLAPALPDDDWQLPVAPTIQGMDVGPAVSGVDAVSYADDALALANRPVRLPGGADGGRFVMRPQLSPADVMAKVAQLFGDPGPPCMRVRARIRSLATEVSPQARALLEEELRRERQFCGN